MGNYFRQSGQRESSPDQFCTVRMSVFMLQKTVYKKKKNLKKGITKQKLSNCFCCSEKESWMR